MHRIFPSLVALDEELQKVKLHLASNVSMEFPGYRASSTCPCASSMRHRCGQANASLHFSTGCCSSRKHAKGWCFKCQRLQVGIGQQHAIVQKCVLLLNSTQSLMQMHVRHTLEGVPGSCSCVRSMALACFSRSFTCKSTAKFNHS